MLEKIKATANYLAEKSNARVDTGIILGTGLGGLVKEIEISATIPYNEIPNFPVSTVDGHAGRLIFGRLGNREVLAMQGRFHYYEGYSIKEIAEIIGKNSATVGTWLSRGRAKLSTKIGDDFCE